MLSATASFFREAVPLHAVRSTDTTHECLSGPALHSSSWLESQSVAFFMFGLELYCSTLRCHRQDVFKPE